MSKITLKEISQKFGIPTIIPGAQYYIMDGETGIHKDNLAMYYDGTLDDIYDIQSVYTNCYDFEISDPDEEPCVIYYFTPIISGQENMIGRQFLYETLAEAFDICPEIFRFHTMWICDGTECVPEINISYALFGDLCICDDREIMDLSELIDNPNFIIADGGFPDSTHYYFRKPEKTNV